MDDIKITIKKVEPGKHIFILSLNRPEKLNAIDRTLLRNFRQQLKEIALDKNAQALILTSELTKAFSAGVDVTYVKGKSNDEAADFFMEISEMLEGLAVFPAVTIAAVNGFTFGAGADIALACDVRVADYSSLFRFPGPQFGLMLGTRRLVNEIGPSVARELLFLNKVISANEALDIGLIHKATEEENLLKTAITLANRMSGVPEYTIHGIRNICENRDQTVNTAVDLAKNSVDEGDFQKRFSQYLTWTKELKSKRRG